MPGPRCGAPDAPARWHGRTDTAGALWTHATADFWAPNLNLARCPLWGRLQETPGEDPFLTSVYGVAVVQAMQGFGSKYLLVAAMPKHFVAYNAPEDNPSRMAFNAIVTKQDLADTYLPAFKAAVTQANASGLMCRSARSVLRVGCGRGPGCYTPQPPPP
jgi:beta-glucosidase